MNIKAIPCLFAVLLPSCTASLPEIQYGDAASFDANKLSIVLPSDNVLTATPSEGLSDEISDTIIVSSSRSWRAVLECDDESSWAWLNREESVNTAGILKKDTLIISAIRNTEASVRNASLRLYAQESSPIIIPVEQSGFSPFLVAKADKNPLFMDYAADTCMVVVRCNTAWTAEIEDSSSAVEISRSKGNGVGSIKVTFPYNFDDERGRTTHLRVKAEGCPDAVVSFVQSQAVPFFLLEGNVDQVQSPLASVINIPLRSNKAWSAEISDCTFSNARLEPSSGDNTVSGFNFIADHGEDPEVAEKHATITIKRQGMEDIQVSFSQQGSLHLHFMDYDPSYNATYTDPSKTYMPYTATEWQFSSPEQEMVPGSATQRTWAGIDLACQKGLYTFTMHGTSAGVWYNGRREGWMVGKSLNDYILFPAIEGMKLTRVLFESSALLMTTFSIRTSDGAQIISGGEKRSTSELDYVTKDINDLQEIVLTDTQPGVAYRMNNDSFGAALSIKDLCLIYQKQ